MHIKNKKITVYSANSEEFVIPQIDFSDKGLRTSKGRFKKTEFASSIYGTGIKDEAYFRDNKDHGVDIVRTYDAFRGEKQILTEEEMIKRYGSKFPEFKTINLDTATEVYGESITLNKKPRENKVVEEKDESVKFEFNTTIEEASKVAIENEIGKREEIHVPTQDEAPIIGFSFDIDEEETTKPSVEFENTSNQTFFESEEPELEISDFPNIIRRTETEIEELKLQSQEKNSYQSVVERPTLSNLVNLDEVKVEEPAYEEEVKTATNSNAAVYNKYFDYTAPSLDFFDKTKVENEEYPEWIYERQEIINKTLESFDIPGSVKSFTKGPSFTRYEINIERGYNVRKILTYSDSFQLELGVSKLRIQAPIPGRNTVGFEVPNEKSSAVLFGDIINREFLNDGKPLNVVLGKDIYGSVITTDIKKWPHGLVAGGTGSGKSVCINTILCSLIMKNSPEDLKLILVDPKTVELISYNNLPHLITPVINDASTATKVLNWCVEEMQRRYQFLASQGVRTTEAYNKLCEKDVTLKKMPFIVVIIDELADLMQESSGEAEGAIQRIAQKARACGIHLILATQNPNAETIKGTIKANIQTRLAFRVQNQTYSHIILDEGGAEALLGRGDMLIKEIDTAVRVQGAYIKDEEIDYVTNYIKSKYEPDYLFEHSDLETKSDTEVVGSLKSENESREMLFECAKLFVEQGSCSVNMLTQSFSLGFNRASRIVGMLEKLGVVSGKNSTKGRDVLVTLADLYDIFEITPPDSEIDF